MLTETLIKKILIVNAHAEDQATYQRYLTLLHQPSIMIIIKETGQDALQFLSKNTVQCILLDYQLPDINGLTFLEKGFELALLKAPVIMLIDQGSEKAAVNALKLGAYDYLLKNDLQPEQLHKAIINAIEKSSLLEKIRLQEAEMRFLAFNDYITDIPNRRKFEELSVKAISRAKQSKKLCSIIIIDIDHFKNINDTLGHEAGDLLLREVTRRLLKVIRQNDTVARLGGDEFAIILDLMEKIDDATIVAESIIREMEASFILYKQELTISVSIGIAVYPIAGDNLSMLMRNADAALYQAKDAGRNTYRYSEKGFNQEASEYLLIENAAHEALKKQEFYLVYQPIFNAQNNTLYGFEALLRWHNEKLSSFSPAQLIPVVEDSGFILPLGTWILETAFRQFSLLPNNDTINLSINVSPKQLADSNFVNLVKRLASEFCILPKNIIFELTETAIIDIQNSVQRLSELNDLGFRIFIDDFGTGYSSLSLIRQLPIAGLKVDKLFVQGIEKNHEDINLIRSIFTLAKNMNLIVIAEGVENQKQLDFIKATCQSAKCQGFLLGKPMLLAEVSKHFKE